LLVTITARVRCLQYAFTSLSLLSSQFSLPLRLRASGKFRSLWPSPFILGIPFHKESSLFRRHCLVLVLPGILRSRRIIQCVLMVIQYKRKMAGLYNTRYGAISLGDEKCEGCRRHPDVILSPCRHRICHSCAQIMTDLDIGIAGQFGCGICFNVSPYSPVSFALFRCVYPQNETVSVRVAVRLGD
jgi:hypothetical protein